MSAEDRRSDDEFVGRVRTVLDAQSLAPHVAERLATARRRAVASIDAPILRAPAAWIPVGALAATLLTVGLLAIDNRSMPPLDDDVQIVTVEDMDLLMDLEFVAWLDIDGVDAG